MWNDDELPEWQYQGLQQTLIHKLMRVCASSIFYNHKLRYAWHPRNTYRTASKVHNPWDWLGKFPIWDEIIWDRCGVGVGGLPGDDPLREAVPQGRPV